MSCNISVAVNFFFIYLFIYLTIYLLIFLVSCNIFVVVLFIYLFILFILFSFFIGVLPFSALTTEQNRTASWRDMCANGQVKAFLYL